MAETNDPAPDLIPAWYDLLTEARRQRDETATQARAEIAALRDQLRAAREEAGLAAERLDALLDRMNAVQSALGLRVTDGMDGDPVAWAAAVKRQADRADVDARLLRRVWNVLRLLRGRCQEGDPTATRPVLMALAQVAEELDQRFAPEGKPNA